ncbi:MAG: hypothetical protein WCH11_00080 [Bdellovibrio sp.]
MIFASRIDPNSRDGELLLVHPNRREAIRAASVAPNLLWALEHWADCKVALENLDRDLRSGQLPGQKLDWAGLESALPRSFLFADGSAFINHIKLVRRARGAELPPTLESLPLMYQAESARFLRPQE